MELDFVSTNDTQSAAPVAGLNPEQDPRCSFSSGLNLSSTANTDLSGYEQVQSCPIVKITVMNRSFVLKEINFLPNPSNC